MYFGGSSVFAIGGEGNAARPISARQIAAL
jgi:hypothetical protein